MCKNNLLNHAEDKVIQAKMLRTGAADEGVLERNCVYACSSNCTFDVGHSFGSIDNVGSCTCQISGAGMVQVTCVRRACLQFPQIPTIYSYSQRLHTGCRASQFDFTGQFFLLVFDLIVVFINS